MKKYVVAVLLAFLVSACLIPAFGSAPEKRVDTLIITGIDSAGSAVMVDGSGYVFTLSDPEDLLPGYIVTVIFDTVGTAQISDDIALSARFSGFTAEIIN